MQRFGAWGVFAVMVVVLLLLLAAASSWFAGERGAVTGTLQGKKVRSPIGASSWPVTTVTCYYAMPSKYAAGRYEQWIADFFRTLSEARLVVFTDRQSLPLLERCVREAGNDAGARTRLVLHERHEWFVQRRHAAYFRLCHAMDAERALHNPQLYAVWNQKPFFVHEAMRLDPFRSDLFLWTDIGCFRNGVEPALARFPRVDGPQPREAKLPPGKLTVFMITAFSAQEEQEFARIRESGVRELPAALQARPRAPADASSLLCEWTGPAQWDRVQGGCFAGDRAAWTEYVALYRQELARFARNGLQRGWFAGKEQNLVAALLAWRPELFHRVDVPNGDWHWYRWYFA